MYAKAINAIVCFLIGVCFLVIFSTKVHRKKRDYRVFILTLGIYFIIFSVSLLNDNIIYSIGLSITGIFIIIHSFRRILFLLTSPSIEEVLENLVKEKKLEYIPEHINSLSIEQLELIKQEFSKGRVK